MSDDTLREPHWPEGWHWSSEDPPMFPLPVAWSMAVGPDHQPEGPEYQAVLVIAKDARRPPPPPHVEFSIGMDRAPVSVVESVIHRSRQMQAFEDGRRPEVEGVREARLLSETKRGLGTLAYALGREKLSAMLGMMPDAPPVLHAMSRLDVAHMARHFYEG